MKIAMGADHGGFRRKEALKAYLEEKGHTVVDVGTDSTESVDYPEFGKKAARLVADGECERGIVICGSGIGIGIATSGLCVAAARQPEMKGQLMGYFFIGAAMSEALALLGLVLFFIG